MPEFVIVAERADGTRYVMWTTDSAAESIKARSWAI